MRNFMVFDEAGQKSDNLQNGVGVEMGRREDIFATYGNGAK